MFIKLIRLISFIIFIGVFLLIIIYPFAFKHLVGTSHYGFLVLLIFFACLNAVYGLGYTPVSLFWRIITSPLITWTCALLCSCYILS